MKIGRHIGQVPDDSVRRKTLRRLTWLFLVAVASLIPACSKGPYGFATVLDQALYDGDLYLLLLVEQGENKAFRYAPHGDSFKASRQVIAIARVRLEETLNTPLELIGYRDYSPADPLENDALMLISSNLCLAPRGGAYEVVPFGSASTNAPLRFLAESISFSAGRRLMVCCGTNATVIDLRSQVTLSSPDVLAGAQLICSRTGAGRSLSASHDLISIGYWEIGETNLATTIFRVTAGTIQSNTISPPLSGRGFLLLGIFKDGKDTRMLYEGVNTNGILETLLVDATGKMYGPLAFTGNTAVDETGETFVSVAAFAATSAGPAEPLKVRLWRPVENREFTKTVDATQVLKTLGLYK